MQTHLNQPWSIGSSTLQSKLGRWRWEILNSRYRIARVSSGNCTSVNGSSLAALKMSRDSAEEVLRTESCNRSRRRLRSKGDACACDPLRGDVLRDQ